MAAVRDRKRKMVDGLVEMHLAKYRESGAELVVGHGRFVAPRNVEVALNAGGARTLRGRTVVIDTGSRARMDDAPGLAEARPLTHVEALELDHVPGHLIVLGGGYVGLELAQAFRRFGSRVTVVERNGALIHREDPDVTEAVEQLFRDKAIEVRTGTAVDRVEGRSGESVSNRSAGAIEGTHLLVAGGRTPNTDGIGLDLAGVETDERGHVRVDERLRTTAEGVWAAGDCAGSPYFTHIGEDDFRVVLANLTGGDRVTTGRQVPFCLFTDPGACGRCGRRDSFRGSHPEGVGRRPEHDRRPGRRPGRHAQRPSREDPAYRWLVKNGASLLIASPTSSPSYRSMWPAPSMMTSSFGPGALAESSRLCQSEPASLPAMTRSSCVSRVSTRSKASNAAHTPRPFINILFRAIGCWPRGVR
jgi:thioredoxin reductase